LSGNCIEPQRPFRSSTPATPWIKTVKPDGSSIIEKRSQVLLAPVVLAAGSAATAVAAEPPLKTLPSQQEIWITGTIQRGNGQYAPGDYATLRLDRRRKAKVAAQNFFAALKNNCFSTASVELSRSRQTATGPGCVKTHAAWAKHKKRLVRTLYIGLAARREG